MIILLLNNIEKIEIRQNFMKIQKLRNDLNLFLNINDCCSSAKAKVFGLYRSHLRVKAVLRLIPLKEHIK